MSGSSSGGSYSPTQGGDGGPDCLSLVLEVVLGSPVPAVVTTLVVGTELDVVLFEGPPRVIAAVTPGGATAGGIDPFGRLLRCLQDGYEFSATVTSITGGAVTVRVQARR